MIHSDLKARNVLLKTSGRGGRGAVAKVADFGLAVRIDSHMTHVSEFQVGLSTRTWADRYQPRRLEPL